MLSVLSSPPPNVIYSSRRAGFTIWTVKGKLGKGHSFRGLYDLKWNDAEVLVVYLHWKQQEEEAVAETADGMYEKILVVEGEKLCYCLKLHHRERNKASWPLKWRAEEKKWANLVN